LLFPSFLKHLVFSEQVTRQLVAWQCGTNYPAVNERDIRELVIPVPSRTEQEAIAGILDCIDTALARTHRALESARDFRDALIHDLLTYGARKTPHQTKTAAGLIPVGWNCEPLIGHLRTNQLLSSGWSNSIGGRMRVEQSLLAESWNPAYSRLGFDPDDANPQFLKPAVEELSKVDS
jgi:hypothetical protein